MTVRRQTPYRAVFTSSRAAAVVLAVGLLVTLGVVVWLASSPPPESLLDEAQVDPAQDLATSGRLELVDVEPVPASPAEEAAPTPGSPAERAPAAVVPQASRRAIVDVLVLAADDRRPIGGAKLQANWRRGPPWRSR